MPRPPDNVVLNRLAAAALCREFLGWQCRIRQLAVRQEGGRPSAGMRPRVMSSSGEPLADGVVTLIIESEPAESTQLFRYQYLRTQDPNERYDNMLEILQGSYFQEPARFSDLVTALFGPESSLAAQLLRERRCVLDFEQYTHGYRIPCEVTRLGESHAFHQATLWHNRMFNHQLPAVVQILGFRPDWPHASAYRQREP
ncbi:MAG TPA: hypothetical protein VGH75_05010 [Steroidobacteraceae bacterium]